MNHQKYLSIVLLLFACSPFRQNAAYLLKSGDECTELDACRSGLVCGHDGTCQQVNSPGGILEGQACESDALCAYSLVCTARGLCGKADLNKEGALCSRADGCAEGLVCASDGYCRSDDSQGTGLDGSDCDESTDCAFGYSCSMENKCTEFPAWNGDECIPHATDAAAPELAFNYDNDLSKGSDFFGLPFPNALRDRGGYIDYSNFPGADAMGAPGPFLSAYTLSLSNLNQGFSPNATLTFRFLQTVDFTSLSFGGMNANFRFVDLTESDPGYGLSPRSRFFATGGRDKFTCQSYLSIRPSEGTPLREGHTYAAVFLSGLLDANGVEFEQADAFRELLSESPTEVPALASAWSDYAPLRRWLEEEEISASEILGATVFTVGHPTEISREISESVSRLDEMQAASKTACSALDGQNSICAQACEGPLGPQTQILSWQAPKILAGTPPFSGASSTLIRDSDGLLSSEGHIERCAAIVGTPDGSDEARGTVVVISDGVEGYATAHQSKLIDQLSGAGYTVILPETVLNEIGTNEDETLQPFQRPHDLTDPIRSRNLYLQGIHELFSFEALLTSMPDLVLPQPNAANHIFLVGHGNGVDLALPFGTLSQHVEALILSSGEGGIIDKYLEMVSPVNTKNQLPFLIADSELNGIHPAMSLLQSQLDARDPMNYGLKVREISDDIPRKHILYAYGVGNDRVSKRGENALITSMRLRMVGEVFEELSAVATLPESEEPLTLNVADEVTQGVKQYLSPEGVHAHEVIFNGDAAVADVLNFFDAINETTAPELSR